MEGIPILMGAGDPVVGVSEKTIGFKKPESWKRSKTFRWGDFFSCWNDMTYHDGGWNVRVAPLMEIERNMMMFRLRISIGFLKPYKIKLRKEISETYTQSDSAIAAISGKMMKTCFSRFGK